jgi:sulfur-carrier protein adenylyltransferase/sulfurtransferase
VISYIQNYRRNRREREALEALASIVDWLTPVGWRIDASLRLTWDANIVVAGRTFPVSLIYPNHFPYSPPMVLPRGATERWSSHQYGPGGELCLQHGPDNWHQDITGADMILSAHLLLQGETAAPNGGEVASRHKTTLGQDLRGESDRLIVTRAVSELIKGMADGTMASGTVVTMFHKETFVYVVASVVDPQGEKWVEPSLPDCLLFEGYERPAVLIRWPESKPTPSAESVTSLKAGLSSAGFKLPAVNHVILVQGSLLGAYLLHEKDDTVTELSVIPPQPAADRLDKNHAVLADRKVSIVGCGSLGSKIAATLARSGVVKFLLVDDEHSPAG